MITNGQTGNASDFVSASSGASDSGKVVKLDTAGQIPRAFIKASFGGDGSDGALSISSGTTTINLGGAAVVVKNYTSISITGTGKLAFSNPHANGTVIILKSQGNVTLTSSSAPMIDASGMGATAGAAVTGVNTAGNSGTDGYGTALFFTNKATQGGGSAVGVGGAVPTAIAPATVPPTLYTGKYPFLVPGAGGSSGPIPSGTGNYTSGKGGRGGAALVIECAGTWNFTTTNGISVAGEDGGSAVVNSSGNTGAGGGGGGGAGPFLGLYNAVTSNTGTVNKSGGVGGNSGASVGSANGGAGGGSIVAAGSNGTSATDGAKSGGDGALGFSLVAKNTELP